MNKIRIYNVKTGKVSEVTEEAIKQLKAGGHFKNFEIVTDNLKIQTPSAPAPVNVVVEEVVPAIAEPEQSIEESAPAEFVDIEAKTEEQPEETGKKSKSSKK